MSLSVSGLRLCYGPRLVLDGVSLIVEPGCLTALLGRNGSGKSTLLKAMAGLLRPAAGSIRIAGRELATLRPRERAAWLGYLPQFHQPAFPFLVRDVVLTGRAALVWSRPGAGDLALAERALEQVGLLEQRERPYTALSGGERQLVLIARALAQGPRLLLLDEPFAHLDLANQLRLAQLLKDLVRGGLGVLAVLHDPNLAFMHADRCECLVGGRLLARTPARPPWDAAVLAEVYGTRLATTPFGDRALVAPLAVVP